MERVENTMALFIDDTKGRVLEYRPAWENDGIVGWQSLQGEFFAASKETLEQAIHVFHAANFEEITPFLAAKSLINDMLEVHLDRGVITPNGEYFGLRDGVRLDDFIEALRSIKDRLPEDLEKQIHCYGIGTPWLEVQKDVSMPIPFGSSQAQLETLDLIGYKNGDQIHYSGKFYNDAFPVYQVGEFWVPDNPDMDALVDVCFNLWDEWDYHKKEYKAVRASIESICIENNI